MFLNSKKNSINKFFSINAKSSTRGFTLAEMIVVLCITIVISAIILFNYDSFSSNATVNTVAQETALTVRKAQSYALGFQAPGNLSSLIIKGYGVHFDLTTPDRITFYTELPVGSPAVVDNQFTASTNICGNPVPGEECFEYYTIQTGDLIQSIIVDGNNLKSTDSAASVDVTFKKPSGEAVFCVHVFGSTCSSSSTTAVGELEIVLISEGGINKTVHIYGNGQITVN